MTKWTDDQSVSKHSTAILSLVTSLYEIFSFILIRSLPGVLKTNSNDSLVKH